VAGGSCFSSIPRTSARSDRQNWRQLPSSILHSRIGTEVLAVSVDSVDTHKGWQEKELSQMVRGGALFLCSPTREAESERFMEFTIQTKALIRGTVLDRSHADNPVYGDCRRSRGKDISEALRQLRALQHNRPPGTTCLAAGSRANPPCLKSRASLEIFGKSGRPGMRSDSDGASI